MAEWQSLFAAVENPAGTWRIIDPRGREYGRIDIRREPCGERSAVVLVEEPLQASPGPFAPVVVHPLRLVLAVVVAVEVDNILQAVDPLEVDEVGDGGGVIRRVRVWGGLRDPLGGALPA